MSNTEPEINVLSQRSLESKKYFNFKLHYSNIICSDVYSLETNSKGYIDLGIAENKLQKVEDVINKRLQKPDAQLLDKSMHYYFQFGGILEFRRTIATFLQKHLKAKHDMITDNIIVTSGVGTAFDILSFTLADPGDCFLSPAPYYTAIESDFLTKSKVEVVSVQLTHQDNYKLTVDKLHLTYKCLIEKGKTVKGIILISPHNPLGYVYERQQLTDILDWAKRLKLHVIMDEIYAFSVWDESAEFVSVAALENIPDPARTHLVWGFSKDFTISGYRTGVIYSWSPAVIAAIQSVMCYHAVPSLIQHQLNCILSDTDWLDNTFFPTNLEALRNAYRLVKGELDRIGIPHLPPVAGLFVWIDLRKFTNPLNGEGQTKLFKQFFFESKVYLEPSNAYHTTEVGWFRIIFSHPDFYILEGMRRIEAVIKSLG